MVIRIRNQQRSKSLNLRRIRKDLARAASLLCLPDAELSILFVGSARMKSLNSEYRGIPRETDVLSFAMNEGQLFPARASRYTLHPPQADQPGLAPHSSPSLTLGDIVISVPRASRQAREYGVTFPAELRRLLIHGLLHLAGYDHEKGRYQKARMEKKEKELLYALKEMD